MRNLLPRLAAATFLLICLWGPTLLLAQSPFTIKGQVIKATEGVAVEYATITVRHTASQQVLAGATTDKQGRFGLTVTDPACYVEISFIGYQTLTINDLQIQNGQADLGTISLSEQQVNLDEVTIAGERSQTTFELDKRVFRVGQDLSSTGASVLEVLNNVPSVNVNIEGQISLRGSQGVQILIDGKPSVIASEEGNALGTITADMVERIEVITNPSAKYEAEGTSGILNIVLKKEEKEGLNGSITLNTGVPHNHSLGLSINRRTNKFNLFSQLGIGYRERPNWSDNINQNLITQSTLISEGEEFRNEQFYNFILGTDYHIDPNNVITLSGNFSYEVEDQPSLTNFQLFDSTQTVISEWNRSETTEATNPKWQYELQYKRDFKDHKDHDLLFSALGNSFAKDQASIFENEAVIGDNEVNAQRTRTDFQETRYTFKLDYTKPITDQLTLEAGAQYVINDVSNDFAVSDFLNEDWVIDSGLTNIFEYDQKVLGIYSTGAYEGKAWGLKLGLRMEHTDLTTLLTNTNELNTQRFANFFPSFHTSYKITETISLQAGYSKRIYRPRLWDLNPFFNIRNNFSIRQGNPDLLPEFTDSYELNTIFIFKDVSFNLGVYHRFTTDVIERVSIFENDVNIVKPINLGTNQATGIEFNAKYSVSKWMSFNGDVNFLFFNRQGTFETTVFDFANNQWSGKLTGKFKLPAKIDLEITGQYQSDVQTVQGIASGNLFADMGLRKKILNGKGVLNVSVRDIFASRFRETNTFQPDFYLYSFRQRGRFITFGFSYGFGKGEAMEYSSRRRR